jgi:hypothetical protein
MFQIRKSNDSFFEDMQFRTKIKHPQLKWRKLIPFIIEFYNNICFMVQIRQANDFFLKICKSGMMIPHPQWKWRMDKQL